MVFVIHKNDDLNTNERIISFYKKELWSSHTIEKARKQKHYNTKWYRKFVKFDFPSYRRYQRVKAIVSNAYRTNKKRYTILSQLGKSL